LQKILSIVIVIKIELFLLVNMKIEYLKVVKIEMCPSYHAKSI